VKWVGKRKTSDKYCILPRRRCLLSAWNTCECNPAGRKTAGEKNERHLWNVWNGAAELKRGLVRISWRGGFKVVHSDRTCQDARKRRRACNARIEENNRFYLIEAVEGWKWTKNETNETIAKVILMSKHGTENQEEHSSVWTKLLDELVGYGQRKYKARWYTSDLCWRDLWSVDQISEWNGKPKGGLFIETILRTIHFRQWVSWSATPKLKRSTLQQNNIWRILVTLMACPVEDISRTIAADGHQCTYNI